MKLVLNLLVIGTYTLQLEAIQLAAAYGIDEDLMTTVIATSPADSRNLRIWGFHDRVRLAQPDDGTARVASLMAKDVQSATLAGEARDVAMPVSTAALAAMPEKLAAREAYLRETGWVAPPRCAVCKQELAAPFRARGVHPDCAPADAQ
jgi:3-hydroxyisobutyrate dehydrogenase-like beta-hydroxyacid dehydrogenase